MLWKGPSGPETLLTCITHNYKSYWHPLGPFRYPRGAQNGYLGNAQMNCYIFMFYIYVSYMWEVFQGHLDPFRASEGPYVNFSQLSSILGQKWPFLGPPWVPKRPQGVPIWLIIMCYTCEKCFRDIWTLSEHHRAQLASILGQKWPFWTPRGYPKGPRDCQYDLKLNVIRVRVSGPFGPFQSIIGSLC